MISTKPTFFFFLGFCSLRFVSLYVNKWEAGRWKEQENGLETEMSKFYNSNRWIQINQDFKQEKLPYIKKENLEGQNRDNI